MKHLVTILFLLIIFRSDLLAQCSPGGIDLVLDKNAKEISIVPCAEKGFCIVSDIKMRGKSMHQLSIAHIDTAMQPVKDTLLKISQDLRVAHLFHEDCTLVILCRHFYNSRITDMMTVFLYHTATRTLETREVEGLPSDAAIVHWRYYHGNLVFSTKTKSSDGVWYLPAGVGEPFPFTFTRENPGQVLSLDVDTMNGRAVIVFNAGNRTMYFETDFQGKSSFANIIGEPATQAQWIPVSDNHSLLMLYYHDYENFFMHPVNILNHRVMPSDTLFCADILVPTIQPMEAKATRTIIVVPHNYVSFYPTYAGCAGDKIYCVTELYCPEYSNYFNGWYLEPRFEGYRYERADVHFFDTNGVFMTNVTYPYGDGTSLRTSVQKVLNVNSLPNGAILLYYLDFRDLSTMLLDSVCELKSPVSTVPLFSPVFTGSYKIVPGAMQSWYGNRFLLSAYRVKPASLRKAGVMMRKMEYN